MREMPCPVGRFLSAVTARQMTNDDVERVTVGNPTPSVQQVSSPANTFGQRNGNRLVTDKAELRFLIHHSNSDASLVGRRRDYVVIMPLGKRRALCPTSHDAIAFNFGKANDSWRFAFACCDNDASEIGEFLVGVTL